MPDNKRIVREDALIHSFLRGNFALKPNLEMERRARRLLADRLRSGEGLDRIIAWGLASLFDPSVQDGRTHHAPISLWQLTVTPRNKRMPIKLRKIARDTEIAWRIADLLNLKKQMKWIETEITRKFGVSRRTMYSAWHAHKDKARQWIVPGEPGEWERIIDT